MLMNVTFITNPAASAAAGPCVGGGGAPGGRERGPGGPVVPAGAGGGPGGRRGGDALGRP